MAASRQFAWTFTVLILLLLCVTQRSFAKDQDSLRNDFSNDSQVQDIPKIIS